MPRTIARSYHGQMLDIARKYVAAGGKEPIDLDDLARFAINKGHWARGPGKLLQMCKRELSRAFREQYHTDPQGRQVRTYHARKDRTGDGTQQVFWADLRTAPAEHMESAFQQRRSQIVGDCRQLKQDVGSYNDNNEDGRHIQMLFDFTDDLAELEQSTEYRPPQAR